MILAAVPPVRLGGERGESRTRLGPVRLGRVFVCPAFHGKDSLNSSRFDDLTKVLETGRARRHMLRALAGAAKAECWLSQAALQGLLLATTVNRTDMTLGAVCCVHQSIKQADSVRQRR